MIDIDKWQEIFATLKSNKLRTFLTAMSVAWGLFMLIFMIGAGNGLERGVVQGFDGTATNSAWIWGGKTTMPYQGMQPGRFIRFKTKDMAYLKQNVKGLDLIAPRITRDGFNVSYKNEMISTEIRGDTPDYGYIEPNNIVAGRFLNNIDLDEKRKVAVIGGRIKDLLFGEKEGEEEVDPLGKYIKIRGSFFQVVGVFKSRQKGERAAEQENGIFVPYTTMQKTFTQSDQIDYFAMTAQPGFKASEVENSIKSELRKIYKVDPEDKNAIGSWNMEEEFAKIQGLFSGINGLVWFVGICTILAGVIGVSNIMLIIVKERTKEIGLRKALGATPWAVISMILQESIFLTMISGYVGLLFGIGIVDLIRFAVDEFADGRAGMFGGPIINFQIAIGALIFLVFAGAFAGILPATKAVSISPVEALRDE